MWQVIGQTKAVDLLQRGLEVGRLSHAYLLVGPAHTGKMTLALNLAQALNCTADEPPCGKCVSCEKIASGKHADIQVIDLMTSWDSTEAKNRAEIGIDDIRQVQHSAGLPPFEGKCKVFIIDEAEFLSTEAANCLLKTLEEPEDDVVFILLTTNEELLPATVVSRCQRIELSPLTLGDVEAALGCHWGVEPEKARLLAHLSHGCLGWAITAAVDAGLLQQRAEQIDRLLDILNAGYEERFNYAGQLATQFSQNRQSVREVLDLWLDWWRDLMLVKIGCDDMVTNVDSTAVLAEKAKNYSLTQIRTFISSIQATEEQLRKNASPRLVLEVLMLDMPRRSNG